jgi:2-amino-4-hydroxy-6-hydroxymethyldihydropteridine diphosphokinase
MDAWQRVFLALGGNLGDRKRMLTRALEELDAHPDVETGAASRIYETAPTGPPGQRDYLNAAAEVWTRLAPQELLETVKGIETRMGRRPGERWGPRVIDIDIILWGERQVHTDTLTIPHPEFRGRAFVLEPLAEIAGSERDPATGRRIDELAAAAAGTGQARPYSAVDH